MKGKEEARTERQRFLRLEKGDEEASLLQKVMSVFY